jgi:hypothetical protein
MRIEKRRARRELRSRCPGLLGFIQVPAGILIVVASWHLLRPAGRCAHIVVIARVGIVVFTTVITNVLHFDIIDGRSLIRHGDIIGSVDPFDDVRRQTTLDHTSDPSATRRCRPASVAVYGAARVISSATNSCGICSSLLHRSLLVLLMQTLKCKGSERED